MRMDWAGLDWTGSNVGVVCDELCGCVWCEVRETGPSGLADAAHQAANSSPHTCSGKEAAEEGMKKSEATMESERQTCNALGRANVCGGAGGVGINLGLCSNCTALYSLFTCHDAFRLHCSHVLMSQFPTQLRVHCLLLPIHPTSHSTPGETGRRIQQVRPNILAYMVAMACLPEVSLLVLVI